MTCEEIKNLWDLARILHESHRDFTRGNVILDQTLRQPWPITPEYYNHSYSIAYVDLALAQAEAVVNNFKIDLSLAAGPNANKENNSCNPYLPTEYITQADKIINIFSSYLKTVPQVTDILILAETTICTILFLITKDKDKQLKILDVLSECVEERLEEMHKEIGMK